MNSVTRVRGAALAALLLLVPGLAGCSDDPTGGITVFAAASLTEAFGELGERFEADHPGSSVTFNFGSSSALAAQVEQGAPADVVATADEENLARLADAGLLDGERQVFATNALTILVEPGNPTGVEDLEDLASPERTVVLCAPQVPCGTYAAQVLADAGVSVTPRSIEENVKGVVTKVASGEADAGIAYVTDALAAADDTDEVPIPPDRNAVARYPIAEVASTSNAAVAAAFVDYVTGPVGREVLEEYGFGPP